MRSGRDLPKRAGLILPTRLSDCEHVQLGLKQQQLTTSGFLGLCGSARKRPTTEHDLRITY
jgi:hypothetical protein